MSYLIYGFLPQNGLAEVVCRTLLHSLWQALAVAAVAGIVLMTTKRAAPATRYKVLLGLFLLFIAATIGTFIFEWTGMASETSTSKGYVVVSPASLTSETGGLKITSSNYALRLDELLRTYSRTAVLAWLLCFALHLFRLHAGFRYIATMRSTTSQVPEFWKNRLEVLQASLGITGRVDMAYSSKVQMPVVIGMLRPLILLPLSLLSNLPATYIESILLHELAHIRRNDFAVNAFQKLVEALFFFNPPLLWLSSKLREEREACCDEVVLGAGCDKRHYLEALLYFQEQSLRTPPYAMALQSSPNHLLNRVKRMLTQENKKLSKMEKNLLVLGLLGLTAFAFAAQDPQAIAPAVKPIAVAQAPASPMAAAEATGTSPAAATSKPAPAINAKPATAPLHATKPAPAAPDTLPARKPSLRSSSSSKTVSENGSSVQEINTTGEDGKNYYIKKVDGKVTIFKVDGKEIATNEPGAQELLENLEAQERLSAKARQAAERDRRKAELQRGQLRAEKERSMQARVQQEREHRVAEQRSRIAAQQSKVESQRARLEEQKQALASNRATIRAQQQRSGQMRQEAQQRTTSEIDVLLQDLGAAAGVRPAEVLSFSLTAEELTLNGQKQSGAVLQKLREKHNVGAGDSFQYQTDGKGTTRTTVVRN